MAGYGPNPGLPRHNLNIAGTVNLPWGFNLSMNSSIMSRSPVAPLIPGVDILGNGTANGGNTALSLVTSGDQFDCFGYSCGKSQLAKAVASFNSTWAGKTAGDGNTIPYLFLPKDYQFGDPTFAQDFRLTKNFTFKERFKLSVFGEFFNAFNIANLQYGTGILDTSPSPNTPPASFAFGQPTNRTQSIFGSSGPRAIQVGGRFTF
jgi:hypothetical protein